MEGNHGNLGDNGPEIVGAKRHTLGDYVVPNTMGCTSSSACPPHMLTTSR